jgi:hypothetical protein
MRYAVAAAGTFGLQLIMGVSPMLYVIQAVLTILALRELQAQAVVRGNERRLIFMHTMLLVCAVGAVIVIVL